MATESSSRKSARGAEAGTSDGSRILRVREGSRRMTLFYCYKGGRIGRRKRGEEAPGEYSEAPGEYSEAPGEYSEAPGECCTPGRARANRHTAV